MLEMLLYLILTFLIIYVLGFGISSFILPKKLKPYLLWLVPWILIIFVIYFSVIFSLLGIPVRISAPIISSILFVLSLMRFKKFKFEVKLSKTDLLIFIIIFTSIIFNTIPIWRREGMLTSISMGNNDIIAYATSGDYLIDHSLIESFYSRVHLTVDNLLHDGYRWGTPIISSFFMTLFRLSGYQYTYLFQAIIFSLMLPLTYVLLRILYRPGFSQSFLVVVITAFNVNLLYMLYHNFFGQVLFWGIEMFFFILFFSYFGTSEEKEFSLNVYDILIALTIATLFFSYHEPAVFMFLPLGFYLVLRFLSRSKPLQYLKKLLMIVVISLGLGSIAIYNAVIFDFGQTFASNKDQPIGWELFRQKIPFANPFEALGFYSIHSFDPLPTLVAVALSLIIVGIIIWGILKSRQKLLVISFALIFIFFCYWTGLHISNFFAYNRAVTYVLPFFIVLFVIGFSDLFRKKLTVKIVLSVILIVFLSVSSLKLSKKFRTIYVAIDKSIISLKEVPLDKIKRPIYTEAFIDSSIPYWVQNWTGYFIYGNNFSHWPIEFNADQSFNKIPDNSLVLSGKYSRWYYPPKRIIKNVVWENEYYKIGEICNSDICLENLKADLSKIEVGKSDWEDILFLDGWSLREGEQRWANEKESTLRLIAKESLLNSLVVEALTLGKPQEITVYINDQLIGSILIDTTWKTYSLPINYPLTPGVQRIKFTYSKGNRPSDLIPGSLDNRTLYTNFKRIAFENQIH